MNTRINISLWSVCVAVLFWPVCGLGAVANLTVTEDTFINSGQAGNNAGATGWFDAGTDGVGGMRRGLLRFNLSTIPAGSTVTSAVVQLTVVRVPGNGPVNSTFDLFRLLANWNEGNKSGNNGAPATAGEQPGTPGCRGRPTGPRLGPRTMRLRPPAPRRPWGLRTTRNTPGAVPAWPPTYSSG